MSEVPKDRRYTKSHEWIKVQPHGVVRVGITAHAQELMGDMVFVDLPGVGRKVKAGEDCAVVESVKAASDVYAPVAGEVAAVNEILSGAPETLNKDPYEAGWLFEIKTADTGAALLDASAYQALLDAER